MAKPLIITVKLEDLDIPFLDAMKKVVNAAVSLSDAFNQEDSPEFAIRELMESLSDAVKGYLAQTGESDRS